MRNDDSELVRNDPESEQFLDDLTALVAEELFASVAVRRPIGTAQDAHVVAELIVDAVLDRYVVRERGEDKPRYSRRARSDRQS